MAVTRCKYRREMLYVKDEAGTKAIGMLMELVKYGRLNCTTVIVDGIFIFRLVSRTV
ncbi:MAG: hypothetical protein ACLS28_17430 [Clostridium neonatale]